MATIHPSRLGLVPHDGKNGNYRRRSPSPRRQRASPSPNRSSGRDKERDKRRGRSNERDYHNSHNTEARRPSPQYNDYRRPLPPIQSEVPWRQEANLNPRRDNLGGQYGGGVGGGLDFMER